MTPSTRSPNTRSPSVMWLSEKSDQQRRWTEAPDGTTLTPLQRALLECVHVACQDKEEKEAHGNQPVDT